VAHVSPDLPAFPFDMGGREHHVRVRDERVVSQRYGSIHKSTTNYTWNTLSQPTWSTDPAGRLHGLYSFVGNYWNCRADIDDVRFAGRHCD
jgi:hypothetical protein